METYMSECFFLKIDVLGMDRGKRKQSRKPVTVVERII